MKAAPRLRAAVLAALSLAFATAATASEEEMLGGHEGWLDRMGGGIKELGMGNAGTAAEDAMPAAYWNPAILAFGREPTVGLGADIRSLSRNGGYVSLQGRVAGNMGLGVGLLNRGDFDVPINDADEKHIWTARPQSIGSYLGVGLKTSRSNAFGAAVQWYSSNLDLGDEVNTGTINVIGIFNLGWYKRWGALRTAVVVRNLGINPDLSANFDQTTSSGDETGGFERTATDFFPKTLVLAGYYTARAWQHDWDLALELLDYQLKPEVLVTDANFHHQGLRAGVDWHYHQDLDVRGGFDRGNLSLGLGYVLTWGKRKLLFDYALVLEKGLLTVNPYAVGLRFKL